MVEEVIVIDSDIEEGEAEVEISDEGEYYSEDEIDSTDSDEYYQCEDIFKELDEFLAKVDKPGSFHSSGELRQFPLPGLQVDSVGSIGLPLSERDA
ncbi:hypothetical protein HK102_006582 [Quaeritorhiza haematococci]|nr:hypothetical protein HK102_006582 [Quaeritorhiza haematococci]